MKNKNNENELDNPLATWHVLLVECPKCGQRPEATREWPGFGGRPRICSKCRTHIPAGRWRVWVVVDAWNAKDAVARAQKRWQEQVEMQGV